MSPSPTPTPSKTPPQPKDYAPVPADPIPERIDDGLSIRAEDADAEDDDNLYTSEAPLLSSRSRDPGASGTHNNSKWFHKIFHSWEPSFESFRRRDPYAWSPPRKSWNWRKITIFTVFATLLGAIIGLSISTAVLRKKVGRAPSYHDCKIRYIANSRTHLPLNNGYTRNYNLNFPDVYPPLRPTRNFACQAAWDSLSYVDCHEKLFARTWDNGKFNLFDPEIATYAEPLCSESCLRQITRAYQTVRSQCTEDDVFDKSSYFGPFSLDPELEDGPLGVITTIWNRLTHTCRNEPQQDRWRRRRSVKCSQVMWDDWKIVDGINAGHLEGLENFKKYTQTYRRESAYSYGSSGGGDICDNLDRFDYRYRYMPERKYGPGVNTTTCGWCTMNWFERKLLGWKEDEVRDPKSGKVVSLPDYLMRIKNAGERCDADAWDRVWQRALKKYKAEGS